VELFARGNVTIEGPYQDRGSFVVRADRADFDQLKSMFVLEGEGSQYAELHVQQYMGAAPSKSLYRKIIYFLNTRDFKLEGFGGGEWNQIDLGQQPQDPPR
jgi:hypothetical protein